MQFQQMLGFKLANQQVFNHFMKIVIVVLTTSIVGCTAPNSPQSLDSLALNALSQIEGEIEISGLMEPVEVIRDEWGIPHIYAQNDQDLFFAQGYVMAQDRLWQMEMWRRWREGRLAEIFGPAALDYDRRARLMMFRGPFNADEWDSYHPDAKLLFTAHANGVNAYIESNRDNLPVEFQLTGVVPEPWTAETNLLRWASLAVPSVRGHAIHEVELALNIARFGVEEANRLAAPDPWDDLVVPDGLDINLFTEELLEAMRAGDDDPFVAGRLPPLEIIEPYTALVESGEVRVAQVSPLPIATEGSNNWVMSPSRSPTGVPILVNDPHRRIEMPALRYFIHLIAPGWNVIGGGEPPFAGVDAGNNKHIAWGFTFAGTDMVDVFVEEVHPEDPNLVRWQDSWEPLRIIEEDILVKGQDPEPVVLKFSRHGPVFYEDLNSRHAYAVRSVVQEHGTAAYKGSFQLAQAESCEDFFERAMHWLVPSHSLICGDVDGNIALQVTGFTPDRNGWNGRLPVPGTGEYEWLGFRTDLPREFNPERGYIATANNNVHPPGYEGRPVFYHSLEGVETSRIKRLHQVLGSVEAPTLEEHIQIQQDVYLLAAERDIPLFSGWVSSDLDIDWARDLIESWDAMLSKESKAGALYVRWNEEVDERARHTDTQLSQRRMFIEAGLRSAIDRLTAELGPDRDQWRHGMVHASPLQHMFVPDFDLSAVERPGGFGSINATGANFRRIIDLADLDRSIATNAPGQSAQPGSPFYGDLTETLGNGNYFPLLYTRGAVEDRAAHRLTLSPVND